MAGNRRKSAQIIADRAKIARLILRGYSQLAIAADTRLSQATVSRDLTEIYKAWKRSALLDFNEARARELARIDELEREYWEGWGRSCADATKTQSKVKGITAKAEHFEVDETGKLSRKATQHIYPLETEKRTTIYKRDGSAVFLRGIERCIELRIKLLGLDAPAQDDDPEALTSFMDALMAAAEHAWQDADEPVWDDDDDEDDP